MFKEFNVKFEDVEIVGGSDNLLEGTDVTKVIFKGDNKMSSLNSTFKDCSELDTIDGELNLDGINNIDNILDGTNLVTSVDLKNINNVDITANNAFPHVNQINIGGEEYEREAIQNVIGSREWTFNNIDYNGTVGDNVTTNTINISEADENTQIMINSTLEQKARAIEIKGQTYQNLINGSEEVDLIADLQFESIEGSPNQFNPHIEQPVCVDVIEGQTYQNLIEGKGEYKLTDTFSTTWTESNNSIENPPSMIEIPEIYGNTIQGFANCVTAKQIVDSVNMVYSGLASLSNGMIKFNDYFGNSAESLLASASSNPDCFIQLKANTKYSIKAYYSSGVAANLMCKVVSPTTALSWTGNFTTDSTGKIFVVVQGTYDSPVHLKIVEGTYDLSAYPWSYDLNYIQSVGDLYVDEEGTPILDEEGNEQYKLEIESANENLNRYDNDMELGAWTTHGGNYETTLEIRCKNNFHPMPKNIKNGDTLYLILSDTTINCNTNIHTYDAKKVYTGGSGAIKSSNFVNGVATLTIVDIDKAQYFSFRAISTNTDCKWGLYFNNNGYIPHESNKTTILMPCQLSRIKGSSTYDVTDKLLFNKDKGTYIIEKNINTYTTPTINHTGGLDIDLSLPIDMIRSYNGINNYPFIIEGAKVQGWSNGNLSEFAIKRYNNDTVVRLATSSSFTNEEISTFLSNKKVYYVTNSPQIIETKILEKPSLETYSPKTYISTNTEIQPSKMTVTNKKVDFVTLGLQANKDYTLQLDVLGYKLPLIYKHYDFKTSLIDELDIVYNSGSLRDYKIIDGKLIVNEVGSSSSYSSISFKNILPNIYNEDFYFTINLKLTSTDSSNSNEIRIQNDNGSTGSFTRFKPNGNVSFDTYDNTIISNGVLPNKDYKIQIHFKKSSNSYDIYLNDNLFTSNKPYESQDYPFGGLRMMIRNCSVEISDIIVHKDKNIDSAQDKLNINLGGMEKELQIEELKRYKIQLSTLDTLTTDKLELSGEGVIVNDVMLFDGGSNEIKQEVEYVEGIQSIGELQEDGTYKIDILSRNNFTPLFFNGKNYGMTIKENSSINFGENIQITSRGGNMLYTPIIRLKPNQCLKVKIISASGGSNHAAQAKLDGGFIYYTTNAQAVSDEISSRGFCILSCLNSTQSDLVGMFHLGFNFGTYTISEIYICEGLDYLAKTSTQSILLPQPLNKRGELKDKFYWDDDKGHYCIEQNINENLEVLDTPNIIDLPHLNKKYSLNTYMPSTYIGCSNAPMQPTEILLKSDITRYKPIALEANKDYTVQFDCKENSDVSIKLNLGGFEKEVDATVGVNHVSVTTPDVLSKDRLYLSGEGNKVADVMLMSGDVKQYPNYFDGIQSVGRLQDDGRYKIDILTHNGGSEEKSHMVSILTNEPLRRVGDVSDKIYWDYSLGKYCIERNVGKNTYSGNETWTVQTLSSEYSSDACGFYTSIENAQKTSDPTLIINNGGFTCYADAVYNYKPNAIGINRNGRLYMSIYNNQIGYDGVGSDTTKIELFKEYLSNNPVDVYYLHSSPIIETAETEGDVIDLPRLYQKDKTYFEVFADNIKPLDVTMEFKDFI